MKFRKLIMEDFKSFRGKHSFDFFGSQPGCYLIHGNNLVRKSLGGNGVGKSTLFEAVSWCFYGRTSRHLKAGDVFPWHSKKGTTRVSVSLEVESGRHLITRTWRPNSLTVKWPDGTKTDVDEKQLAEVIGLSEAEFYASIYYGQFNEGFMDQKPTAMLAMFSDILDLDFWTKRAVRAMGMGGEAERRVASAGAALEQARTMLTHLKKKKGEILENKAKWDTASEDRIKQATTALKTAKDAHTAAVATLTAAQKDAPVAPLKSDQLTALENRVSVLTEAASDFKAEAAALDRQISELETRLEKMKGIGAECSRCGQPIDKKHVAKELAAIHREITTIDEAGKVNAEKWQAAVNKRDVAKAKLNKHMGAQAEEVAAYRERAAEIRGYERDVQIKKSYLTEAVRKMDEAQIGDNPFDADLADYQKDRGIFINMRDREKAVVEEKTREADQCKFWEKAFKDIRLMATEEAIGQLELEVNNSIVELGMPEWTVKFDIERETKSGGLVRGFGAIVQGPDSPRGVPWAAWSGGEGQRLRLAAQTGLAALILARKGLSPSIEVYDEPSKHLSPEGLRSLVEFLGERARTTGKQIYLIDHHSFESGDFTGTKLVEMRKDGSHFN